MHTLQLYGTTQACPLLKPKPIFLFSRPNNQLRNCDGSF